MAQPGRDPIEGDLMEEESTKVVEGFSDAGVTSFAFIVSLRLYSLRLR